jgi:hypothetical protein
LRSGEHLVTDMGLDMTGSAAQIAQPKNESIRPPSAAGQI